MYYYILSCGLYYSIYLTLGLTIERCIILLLNQRQLEILLELFEKPEVYMTASYFSSKHQCSLRTIQNDIRQIKTELESTNCVIFESTTRKGKNLNSGFFPFLCIKRLLLSTVQFCNIELSKRKSQSDLASVIKGTSCHFTL